MRNFKLVLSCLFLYLLFNNISINASENKEINSTIKSRTFELIYKAVIDGDQINKGELISISEIDDKSGNDNMIEYINSLLYVENANQLGTVIQLNDSISFKSSEDGHQL